MRTILSLFVVLLFVAGCGGGDSVESPTAPQGPSEPEVMEPVEPGPEVPEMPVTPDPVEPDPVDPVTPEPPVTPDPEVMEPEVPDPEPEMVDLEIPEWMPSGVFGLEECVNTDDLLYFFNAVWQGETRFERFNERPVLSLAEETTDFQEDIVRRALEYINASLPDNYKVGMRNARIPAMSGEPPNGEIYVDFAPQEDWEDLEGVDLEGVLGIARYYSSFNESDPELSERSAHIWIDPQYIQIRYLESPPPFTDTNKDVRDGNNIGLLAHEILHALGFPGHVSVQTNVGFRSAAIFSIMWPTASIIGQSGVTGESRISTGAAFLFQGILHEVDRAGLRYLYEELETGDDPRDITEEELDMWLADKGCFSQ